MASRSEGKTYHFAPRDSPPIAPRWSDHRQEKDRGWREVPPLVVDRARVGAILFDGEVAGTRSTSIGRRSIFLADEMVSLVDTALTQRRRWGVQHALWAFLD